MRRILLVVTCVLTLSACAQDYGYGYCYDPYQGPRGYTWGGLFDSGPHCANPNHGSAYYRGPYDDGYRGPYFSGPYYDANPAPAD